MSHDSDYEDYTPLDWAKYELDSVFYDFRIDPRAIATINHIVEELYKKTIPQKQLCGSEYSKVMRFVLENKEKFDTEKEVLDCVMKEFRGHVNPSLVEGVVVEIYGKDTLPKC